MPTKQSNTLTIQPFSLVLYLADSSLIMGHRLSEWTGHGPMLEQDIAISNIALDLIGQSRNFYQYAAAIANTNSHERENITEDDLAYLRDAGEFKNLLLTELPNGDWGKTILKIFLFSTWQFYFYQKLIYSADKQLSAIAEKSLKEVTYHVKWSSEWVIRLGDGTEESHQRMEKALEELWQYTGEMFVAAYFENEAVNNQICTPVNEIKNDWLGKIKDVLEKATLPSPNENAWMHSGGKNGIHTEHLGYLLAEMQFLQRAYPGCEW
ncbi:MAG: phenylacetate-CoA oxygenase subunit PaaC [Bacteroidota bacterium]|nr:phenylacetate-CoA oxygenase subunit PaaC [Bacteroidota bacterium]